MLVHELEARSWKLVCAESCTGGLLSSWITATPGSSAYFLGAVVSYANEVKHGVLRVSADTLASHGAVSEACASEMAAGALLALGGDLAIAITGIAGPDGGSADKPVGTVHICACDKSGRSLARAYRLTGNRQDVRERSCHAACLLALELMGQAG